MREVSIDVPYKKAWNILNKEEKTFVKRRLGNIQGSCEYVTLTFQFTEKNEVAVSAATSFNIVWEMYGKKVGKAICEKLWARLSQKEKELAMQHIPKYVAATPDKQYRKNFATYLRQQGWYDEVISGNNNGREQRLKDLAGHLSAENGVSGAMPF